MKKLFPQLALIVFFNVMRGEAQGQNDVPKDPCLPPDSLNKKVEEILRLARTTGEDTIDVFLYENEVPLGWDNEPLRVPKTLLESWASETGNTSPLKETSILPKISKSPPCIQDIAYDGMAVSVFLYKEDR